MTDRQDLARKIEAEIMRQYEANPKWDEAKDVIEGLDCAAILAAITPSTVASEAARRIVENCDKNGHVYEDMADEIEDGVTVARAYLDLVRR